MSLFGIRSVAPISKVFDIKYLGVGGLLNCATNHMDEPAARQQQEAGFRIEVESMLVS